MQKLNDSILVGDTLTTLKKVPDNTFDVGVTSPPYNKQENKKGWLVKNVVYDTARDTKTEEEYQENQIAVLNELFRTTKAGGSFFYNHKTRWERGVMLHPISWLAKTDWTIRQEIIWDRGIAANIRGWRFWQVEERIYWLYKPKGDKKIGEELESRHALLTSVWRMPPERNNTHPAPFPLTLPTRCIYSILGSTKGKLVVDPYLGHGTTAVAAALLGHHFFGIDISPQYVKEAKQRVKNKDKERAIVETEMAKHKVTMTFKERKEKGKFVGKHRVAKKKT
ncbi:site-specific DNA-methyltransferase [Patescibacteria group bacterium]|nr:site-specific DNA-methyltransferase [Patescibacteria group bacterium]